MANHAGQWDLRKGVLGIGGFCTFLVLAVAVLYLFIPAIPNSIAVVLLITGLFWGQGVWAVYNRELKGSASSASSSPPSLFSFNPAVAQANALLTGCTLP
jgi:hypothetical protein